MDERIIGCYDGVDRGVLILVFGATHGNESAGVHAIEEVFRLLSLEPEANPGFRFAGRLVGILGNRQAFARRERFLKHDLNRLWTKDQVRRVEVIPETHLEAEDKEMMEILELIHKQLTEYKPEVLILLDLHTTSAEGGIFCIPSDDMASLRLAKALLAPVILGLLEGIEGTLLHYAADNHFEMGGFPKHSFGVAFESGQHDDPLSVNRATAAIINMLRAAGCIQEQDVDSRHEAILKAHTKGMPTVTILRYVHHLRPGDGFTMHPGYTNFQPVKEGEHIADDHSGPIHAPQDGLLLMPLYQAQGSDGFFIVEEIES